MRVELTFAQICALATVCRALIDPDADDYLDVLLPDAADRKRFCEATGQLAGIARIGEHFLG